MNLLAPASHDSTISALRGAIVTRMSTKRPSRASLDVVERRGSGDAPRQRRGCVCSSGGIGPIATTSLMASRPPA